MPQEPLAIFKSWISGLTLSASDVVHFVFICVCLIMLVDNVNNQQTQLVSCVLLYYRNVLCCAIKEKKETNGMMRIVWCPRIRSLLLWHKSQVTQTATIALVTQTLSWWGTHYSTNYPTHLTYLRGSCLWCHPYLLLSQVKLFNKVQLYFESRQPLT